MDNCKLQYEFLLNSNEFLFNIYSTAFRLKIFLVGWDIFDPINQNLNYEIFDNTFYISYGLYY